MREIREEEKRLQRQVKEIGLEETLRQINRDVEERNKIEKEIEKNKYKMQEEPREALKLEKEGKQKKKSTINGRK